MDELFRFNVIRPIQRCNNKVLDLEYHTEMEGKVMTHVPDDIDSLQNKLRKIALSSNSWTEMETSALDWIIRNVLDITESQYYMLLDNFVIQLKKLTHDEMIPENWPKSIEEAEDWNSYAYEVAVARSDPDFISELIRFSHKLSDLFLGCMIIRAKGPSQIIENTRTKELAFATEFLLDKPALYEIADMLRAVELIVAESDLIKTSEDVKEIMHRTLAMPRGIFTFLKKPIRSVGIMDLLTVKQHIKYYENGEIARVENILKGEERKHDIKQILSNENDEYYEINDYTEKELEITNSDKVSIKSEIEKILKEEARNKCNLNAKYEGNTYMLNDDFASTYNRSLMEAKKLAVEIAKDITNKAASQIAYKARQGHPSKLTETFEENESLKFENKEDDNISGIYQWLNKVYTAQVFKHGRHLLLDIMVPEPASSLISLIKYKKSSRSEFEKEGDSILTSSNPEINRNIELMELKKACIAIMDNNNETVRGYKPNVAVNYFSNAEEEQDEALSLEEPVLSREQNLSLSSELGERVRWFEQAFEWDKMGYVFYPYYWGRREKWIERLNMETYDPLFKSFLMVGYARVLLPVRNGYEDSINFYMLTGRPWMGGSLPSICDRTQNPLYMSIMEERMQKILVGAYNYAKKWMGQGKVANYIPELAKADSNNLSICITDLSGYTHSIGDSKVRFTVQSIAKIILLVSALKEAGFDEVFSRVGMESMGDPFNSIIRLETMSHKPLNPMINAGAIAVTSCISGKNSEERFEKILNTAKLLLGNSELNYNPKVYQSENEHGGRNRSLAYMMSADGVLSGKVEEHLDVYFKACSIMATCEEISYLGSIISNNGVSPRTGEHLIVPFEVKIIRSLMSTCGMYDASGEFAFRVGIPSKSGVGGGIMGAVPNRVGIGVYSPALDQKGNSFCGVKAMEFLSKELELSIF